MKELFGKSVEFFKMQGCGNDFVVIDNRSLKVPEADMAQWSLKVCKRAFGIHADGMFFLDNAPEGSGADYRWHFFNSDGSRAEMCGNASRCAARLALALDMAPVKHVLLTDVGPIKAEVLDSGQVKVQLTPPKGLELNMKLDVKGVDFELHFADTGVPHAVIFVQNAEEVDVPTIGAAVRYADRFAPAGTNVNFVQVRSNSELYVRTYERGVEAETYACGTGVAAAQLIANALGLTGPAAAITTSGGESLKVSIEDKELYLQGAAELVFKGELYLDPLGLAL